MRAFRLLVVLFSFASFIISTTSARTQSGRFADAASGKPPSVTPRTPPSQNHPDTATSAGAQPDYSKEAFVIEQLRSRFRFENDGTGREENTIRVRVRPEPFKLGPPNEKSYRIKLELAPRYRDQVPVAVNVERDYGSYHSSYKLEGYLLTAERTLRTRVGELSVPRANDYRALRRSVLADVAQFVTSKNSVADIEHRRCLR
jgi:hypothetical protein